jgi:Helix-turn-helix domain
MVESMSADLDDWANSFVVGRNVDEAGLKPAAWRVLGHLNRRANGEGVAWPGIDSMAKICRLNKKTVIKAIKQLESRGFIRVERRSGEDNRYHILPSECWKPEPLPKTVPVPKEVTVSPVNYTSITNNNVTPLPLLPEPLPKTVPVPLPSLLYTSTKIGNERYPKEGIPIKVSQEKVVSLASSLDRLASSLSNSVSEKEPKKRDAWKFLPELESKLLEMGKNQIKAHLNSAISTEFEDDVALIIGFSSPSSVDFLSGRNVKSALKRAVHQLTGKHLDVLPVRKTVAESDTNGIADGSI